MWGYLRTIKDNTWLPVLMPWVWHWLLGGALLIGVGIGVWIAIYTLMIRGLW